MRVPRFTTRRDTRASLARAPDGRTMDHIFGSSTLSMTWMTPFDCITSAMVTLATLPF
jgi:hypothetical protein